MIIDRGKFALAPQPERKSRKKADPDQEKVKKPRASNAKGGAGGRGAGGRGVGGKGTAQSLAGPVHAAGKVVSKALGNGRGLDVWHRYIYALSLSHTHIHTHTHWATLGAWMCGTGIYTHAHTHTHRQHTHWATGGAPCFSFLFLF